MRPSAVVAPVLTAGLWASCASPPADDTPSEPPSDEAERALHGSLTTRYRGRSTDGDQDHDLYAVLALDLGDAQRDDWSASLMARAAYDLDGQGDVGDPFASLSDAQGEDLDLDLYHAWVDVHSLEVLSTLRFGRQLLYETPELAWFDGAHLASTPRGTRGLLFGAYGGVPVHLFESSSSGDALAGFYLEGRPWEGARARLDWMHLEDETVLAEHEDDLFGIDLRQGIGEKLHLNGRYSRIEQHDRDLSLGASWYPNDELTLRATHYRLLRTQRNRSLEADPFFDSLRELFPYHQTGVLVTKDFGERASLEVGLDVRRVDEADDEGEFNRDFDRGFVTTTLLDVLPADLVLSLTGDVWDGGDGDVNSLGAELSLPYGERLEWALGTYYSLYKYDLFLDSEREDVRTWYVRWRKRRREGISLDLLYEYEWDDDDSYHNLRLVGTWLF